MTYTARVINLADYRQPTAEIVTSLHIEITRDNKVRFDQIKVSKNHVMAMMEMLVATCAYLVKVQNGRA
jgi:hypothetical protein